MNHLKISTRLLGLIGFLSLLLVAIGSVGLFGIIKSNDALKTVYEDRTVPLVDMGHMIDMVNRIRTNAVVAASAPTPEVAAKANADTQRLDTEIDALWKKFMSTVLTPEEERLANNFKPQWEAYQASRNVTLRLAMEGNMDAAKDNAANDAGPKFTAARESLFKLIDLQGNVAKSEYDSAVARYETILIAAIAAIVGGVLLAFLFGVTLVRTISRSLCDAIAAADAVAQGDLTRAIQVKGQDEVAQLLRALAGMQQNLQKVVSDVRVVSDSVATGSEQIATGTLDLSQRTEMQASNLEETAASMEELTVTVKQNADTAYQASQLAQNASHAAVRGGEVVNQVVSTMQEITASSQKIADIISVIDGIAFQTNILALNAAVEAARAGEQGRGFAVVAGEVRTLAQRSAAAAKEIKDLITASVERVEAGSQLVTQAGDSVSNIVTQVQRVTDLINEITAASKEQASGISQVGDAVSQLDQATQQNAALVEESTAAAESLKLQAARLIQVVGVFKLSDRAA